MPRTYNAGEDPRGAVDPASPSATCRALARVLEGTPALLVVAHPDDETIGFGGHLPLSRHVLVLHLTDGAPRDPAFARAAGYGSRALYARARALELDRALTMAGVARARRRSLGLPDQDACENLVEIARAVRALARELGARIVITHAYEGGHPDHDAAAFAAAAARALDRSLVVLEMPFYHRAGGALVTGRFIPALGAPEHEVPLSRAQLAHKRAMLRSFATQAGVLAAFDPSVERFRIAPEYDFSRPPHGGALHYETLGWPMTGARFRELAAAARRELGSELRCNDR